MLALGVLHNYKRATETVGQWLREQSAGEERESQGTGWLNEGCLEGREKGKERMNSIFYIRDS